MMPAERVILATLLILACGQTGALRDQEFFPAGRVRNDGRVPVVIHMKTKAGALLIEKLPNGVSMDLPPDAAGVIVYRDPLEAGAPDTDVRVRVELSDGRKLAIEGYGKSAQWFPPPSPSQDRS